MKVLLVVVSFLLLESVDFAQSLDCNIPPKNKEVELRHKLFCNNYDKEVRPTLNLKNATIIKIRPSVLDYEVHEWSQTIKLDTWVRMEWKDEHLKWNKEEYDGIASLPTSGDDIWKPDLTSHHSEGTQYDEACSPSNCIVYDNGNILCVPPCTFSGQCEANLKYWPFDMIRCTLRLGAWVHTEEEVKFVTKNMLIYSDYEDSWICGEVLSHNLTGNNTKPSVRYMMWCKRQAAAEVMVIISPALILAALNLVSLWLTPNCSERILLLLVSLISHILFLQQLSWIVPRNGQNTPDALIYFRDSLVIATILLVDTFIKRGLLACKSPTPAWIISTTDALRGHKVGQLMFTNPYIINKVQLNTESMPGEDFTNLVEGQPTDESDTKPKTQEKNNWYIAVRVLDTALFGILVITYLIMIIGWIHLGYSKSRELYDKEDLEKDFIVPQKV